MEWFINVSPFILLPFSITSVQLCHKYSVSGGGLEKSPLCEKAGKVAYSLHISCAVSMQGTKEKCSYYQILRQCRLLYRSPNTHPDMEGSKVRFPCTSWHNVSSDHSGLIANSSVGRMDLPLSF